MADPVVRIQSEDFNVADEILKLTAGRKDIGAVVTFTGLCRDEGGKLSHGCHLVGHHILTGVESV